MERVKGIEPSSQPWEGHILPLNHTRTVNKLFLAHGHPPGNLFARLSKRLQFADLLPQPGNHMLELRRRQDFPAFHFAHIKAVDRRAALSHDARSGNIQMQFGEGI